MYHMSAQGIGERMINVHYYYCYYYYYYEMSILLTSSLSSSVRSHGVSLLACREQKGKGWIVTICLVLCVKFCESESTLE